MVKWQTELIDLAKIWNFELGSILTLGPRALYEPKIILGRTKFEIPTALHHKGEA